MNTTSKEDWERPGWRRFHEKRGDEVWEVTIHSKSKDCVLLEEYWRASRRAMEEGREAPSLPPVSELTGDEVVCVERTERRVGGYSRGSDGTIFWESESGMVYRCDANGEPLNRPDISKGAAARRINRRMNEQRKRMTPCATPTHTATTESASLCVRMKS